MAKAYAQPKEGQAQAREEGGKGADVTALYRHPETGKTAIVQYDPLYGNSQANAFERLGYEYVREAKPEEIKTVGLLEVDANRVDNDAMKGLNARVSMLEGVAEQNELLKKQLAEQTAQRVDQPKDETDLSGNLAKQSAVDQVNTRGQGDSEIALNDKLEVETVETANVEDTVEDESDESSESDDDENEEEEVVDLKKLNRDDLNALAEEEGVEDPSNLETYKTKADLIAAVEAKRAENTADNA